MDMAAQEEFGLILLDGFFTALLPVLTFITLLLCKLEETG
jgi:hypothetical protein